MTVKTAPMSGPEEFLGQEPMDICDVPDHQIQLDYTSIPSEAQKGFLSPRGLTELSTGYMRGLRRATSALVELYASDDSVAEWPRPERRIIPVKNHERLVLVTEPNPETEVNVDEAKNEVLLPGLSEMDIGSAMLLHKAIAKQHPDRRIITVPTLGVSTGGHTLSILEGYYRSIEDTAADNLRLLPWILKDGETHLNGTSLGSAKATFIALKNLAADPESQINLTGVNLISPAVGARNIPEDVGLSEADAADPERIEQETRRFFMHMPGDVVRMAVSHPHMVAECASIAVAYAVDPKKLPHRIAAMMGNLNSVKNGIEWPDLKAVAQNHDVHVLGGQLDPLVQAQLPQWQAIRKAAPRTQIRILEGRGHAMTVDSRSTAKHLAEMEEITQRGKQPLELVA